jgi:hypothetical protein
MTALARHLQARNHEVVFLYSKTAAGLPFVPPPGKDHLKERQSLRPMGFLSPPIW